MNTILWIIQLLLAATFFYSGVCKMLMPASWLITHGQTGVVGLPAGLIKFIGICEILGTAGLILPVWLNIFPALTSITAMLFCVIMVMAMRTHYKLKEPRNVFANVLLFLLCAAVAYGRL
jgi:hypothetical protein